MLTEIIVEIPFDAIAQDKDGKIILLIEVKPKPPVPEMKREWFLGRVKSYLAESYQPIPYAMLVDLEEIAIHQLDCEDFSEPVLVLNTPEILSDYEPQFGEREIYYHYLVRLIEAWLRDLAYHWKLELPPASEKIAEIGLLERLEGGKTSSGEISKW